VNPSAGEGQSRLTKRSAAMTRVAKFPSFRSITWPYVADSSIAWRRHAAGPHPPCPSRAAIARVPRCARAHDRRPRSAGEGNFNRLARAAALPCHHFWRAEQQSDASLALSLSPPRAVAAFQLPGQAPSLARAACRTLLSTEIHGYIQVTCPGLFRALLPALSGSAGRRVAPLRLCFLFG